MSLDLDFDDAQNALIEGLTAFCRERCDEVAVRAAATTFPRALWSELAELGVLSAGAPSGEGGALEICAAMETLGRAAFPGPLVGTFVAMQLLEGELRDAVADGHALVSFGSAPLMPFAPLADVFLEVVDGVVYRAERSGAVEPVEVLGGEPWGRVALQRGAAYAESAPALSIGEMARAAYLAALADRLIDETATHARTRKQFGRAIGEFQAVAHPLADCRMRLSAARMLARAAAWRIDAGDAGGAEATAASARLSSTAAAVEAAHVAHQAYGAVGITLEGPAFHLTRRIRQLASDRPEAVRARDRVLARIGLPTA
jgi:alkylation response protein AidB-like acyl-CoA dehydrogenase